MGSEANSISEVDIILPGSVQMENCLVSCAAMAVSIANVTTGAQRWTRSKGVVRVENRLTAKKQSTCLEMENQ